ncbi:MAG: GNAT family N-acetyltransferase [Thermoleophilia bacterium]
MSIEYRPISAEEFPAFAQADKVAFGASTNEQDLAAEALALEFDRTVAAFECARIVGTTATLSLDLTLPGGRIVPAGGLTWTGVLPTYRRRGLVRTMIARQLDLSHERGEPVNILQASESTIYGRFGYGTATYELGFSLETAHAAFRPEAPAESAGARFEVVDDTAAFPVLSSVFQSFRLRIPGTVGRSEALWRSYLADPEHHRDGAGGMFHVLHRDASGNPDGYVSYRMRENWERGVAKGELFVQELMAGTPAAHAVLWRYCLDMDLVAAVKTAHAPVDEPLRWLLRDPRRLGMDRLNDGLWVRILDVPAALGARSYCEAGGGPGDALVLEVFDTFRPTTAGRYLLDAGPDGAECSRTTRSGDVALDISDLGATYLGAVGFSTLVRAGRVRELTEGAATRADALFRTERAPWCSTHF